ncbi:MAG: hypothetical protein SF097_23420 [Acidobacteriota bacterium]|nr:hypothetical protein [Acidobacteriota bacterium]
MIRRMILSIAVTMMISMLAVAVQAQDRVNVVINSVTINRTAAAVTPGKSRTVFVDFQWLCQPTGAKAKLVTLEVVLETMNTDGKRSTVTKKLKDWTENRPIDTRIDLPMAEGVFAKGFTLTLRGKFQREGTEGLMDTSAVKKGTFPPPPPTPKK